MKWNNKGHEYDEMYKAIESKKKYYMFGAGDYGELFYTMMNQEIELIAYIDNDSKKQGKEKNGLPIIPLKSANVEDSVGIIITMSQVARVNPMQQLLDMGYKYKEDFFLIEEFISVYYAYKKDKVYFSAISFLPSTRCNLNCKKCLNFNPYASRFYEREWDDLVRDVDTFFNCVDYIMLFHVSGGEPLLYKNTAKLLKYISDNYGNRIGTLRTVTNGTVVPREEILEVMAEANIEVTVDDYREAVPQYNENFEKLCSKFDEYKIKYYVNKVDSWIDLAPTTTDYSDRPEEWLISHRDRCSQSWQELRDGKLYSCNYAAYATVAGIAGEQDIEEAYDLLKFDANKKKELVEFRLGYTTKGYTNFCKQCRGFTPENNIEEKPAEQV